MQRPPDPASFKETGFARRLMLPVSNDTLLLGVRRRAHLWTEPLAVVGIDDWEYRRNHRYGTIVCDPERQRVVALLPDRAMATAEAWLRQHPSIGVVSRGHCGGYGEAAAKAVPDTQVTDRWHLMGNASAASLDLVRKSMRAIRSTLGAATISLALLTAAERLQYEGFLRREETTRQVLAFKEPSHSIQKIVRRTKARPQTGAASGAGRPGGRVRVRQSSLAPHLPCWTPNGMRAAATAPNGQPGTGAPIRCASKACTGLRQPGPWHG